MEAVCTSDLFKNEGIQAMDSYIPNQVDHNEDVWTEFISKDRKETSINLNAQSQEVEPKNASNDSIDNYTDDEWCETTERSSGVIVVFEFNKLSHTTIIYKKCQ